ncbi:rhodanese-like domain-containing protein [Pseudalkalibacillus sp. SCS-8]|uniref:rhodanese-like domain-containing protein n=1 Tax=Pseudalkalibacillus nanhaiensis TaxID=3115291 RepID=UPI0032D9F139
MKEVTANEVEELLANGDHHQIIDVRETSETASGMIPGAINIPLGLLEFRMHELDKSKRYILVCRSGARSWRASKFLQDHGYDVLNMTDGMLSWEGKTK